MLKQYRNSNTDRLILLFGRIKSRWGSIIERHLFSIVHYEDRYVLIASETTLESITRIPEEGKKKILMESRSKEDCIKYAEGYYDLWINPDLEEE